MGDTPRTDAVVIKVQREEVSFCDAYFQMLELARDLEREINGSGPAASRKGGARRPNSSSSAKKGRPA